MKTKKHFAEICLILFFTAIISDVKATGIHSGTRNSFLQERYQRMEINHTSFSIPVLLPNQRKFSKFPLLKTGYMARQRLDNLVNYYWDAAAGKWEPSYRQSYYYDSFGNMDRALYGSIDPWNGQWKTEVKESLTYFSKGKVSCFISYKWSETKNQFVGDFKQEHSYSQNGLPTGSSYFIWDLAVSQWMQNYKIEYITDPKGNITKTLVCKWNSATGKWKNERKDESTYDSAGKLTQFLSYSWSESSGVWESGFKDEYMYDENGNKIQTLYYRWSDAAKWVAVYRDVFTYDTYNNLTRLISYQPNETSGGWSAVYMEENSYNNSFCFCDLILPFTDDETMQYFCHQLNSITEYDMNSVTGKWNPSNRIVFTYTDLSTGIFDLSGADVKVYPNPADDYVTVQCAGFPTRFDFKLFDMSGRELISGMKDSSEKILLQGFKSGVYFYQLKAGSRKVDGKLVIR